MGWREAFLTRFGTAWMGGCPLGVWLRVLRDNRFSIDPPYWGRVLAISATCIPNSVTAWWENTVRGGRIRSATDYPPLFILGIWRSGTTLLHNLLTRDERFAFPNNYQVCFPQTFLTTERMAARFVGAMTPAKRPQDNMSIGVREPQEDEFAFASMTGRAAVMAWCFPRNAEYYDRYLTLRGLSEPERAEWSAALAWFVKKLSYRYGRPLVLKSPGHTCRIKVLLDLFPDARFVHIHRNPYDIFPSMRHTFRAIAPWLTFQRSTDSGLDDRVVKLYRDVYDAFFEERGLIPAGRYCGIAFEDLEKDPLGQMRRLYETLILPDFTAVEPALQQYVTTLAGYKKNTFKDLPAELKCRLAQEWRRCFDEWGYSIE